MTDANVLEYTYNSDKLKSYDGNLCEYDALGNPTLYRNKSLKWNNLRNLAKFDNIEFTYNANGIRTKKVNGNHESKYYYLDNRLLSEKRDIHSSDLSLNDCLYEGEIYYTYTDKTDISYMYNANELTSFTIAKNGIHQTYYYRKNLQGDITHIYDISGTLKAEYTYDAWGNHEILTNIDNIANINPFRYRGYYYDTETGLYYLQSRYYDPQTGRFINADVISILDETKDMINGLNLYVYCNNNPVMFTDSTGLSPEWDAFWRGLGRIFTGVLAIIGSIMVIASGVALIPMLIIAGITLVSGAITAVNGAADIGQGFSGYNFMRDGLFSGNQTAYNIFSGVAEGVAIIGSLICGGWLKYNQPRIKAYKNIGSYNVGKKHLPGSGGDWAKFSSVDNSVLRSLGKEAIKNTSMKQLLINSPDSFKLIYNAGRIVGTKGELSVRLVFTKLGKIITFFPF